MTHANTSSRFSRPPFVQRRFRTFINPAVPSTVPSATARTA